MEDEGFFYESVEHSEPLSLGEDILIASDRFDRLETPTSSENRETSEERLFLET